MSPTTQISSEAQPRYHYMDNLRALALIAGVIFHAGLSHTYIFHEVWPTADNQSSIIADYFLMILHTFRMPLFFLIAGFFAHMLIQKRGTGGFIKHRFFRITLPFLVFWPLCLATIIAIFVYAAKNMPVNTFIVDMIRMGMENPEAMQGQEPPLSTTHLWFLYYLTMFCAAAAIVHRFAPLKARAIDVLTHPFAVLLVYPLLTALFMINKFMPHPAPEKVIPELWALGFFGVFFLVGWAMFIKQEVISNYQRRVPFLMASVAINYGIFLYAMPEPISIEAAMAMMNTPPELTPHSVLRLITTGFLAWHATLLCLAIGQRYLNKANRFMRYIADGSYWVYIVHIPVVFYLQFYFHTLTLPIITEFLLITAITLGVGYLSYAILVRHTPIGWWLNGRKKKAPKPEV